MSVCSKDLHLALPLTALSTSKEDSTESQFVVKQELIKLKVNFKKDYLSHVERKHPLYRDGRRQHRERLQQASSNGQEEAEPRFQLSYCYRCHCRPLHGCKLNVMDSVLCLQELDLVV
jgi:hypothetical protein